MLKDIILKSRSYRRFYQEKEIDKSLLIDIIDTVRNTASARNIQPLKYSCTTNKELCNDIFSTLSWAGYLENAAPKEGERPTGYILIYNDTNIAPSSLWDQGIVSQTISMLCAEQGLGACIIASANREKIKNYIDVPANLELALVIAVGYPKEDVRLVTVKDNQYKYYRDGEVHYVPKRSLKEIYVELEK